MRTLKNIFRLILIVTVAVILVGCHQQASVGDEDLQEEQTSPEQYQRFDPLDLPADKEIVPEAYSMNIDLTHPNTIVTSDRSSAYTAGAMSEDVPLDFDSVNSQAFRIQILTSKVFGKAQKAVKVAEEIFDRPVYLDYEVPYFKVRVGSFYDRDQAEDYMMRARAAGYKEAWIVVTNVEVKEAKPLYFDNPFPVYSDSTDENDSPDTLFKSEDEPVTDG